MKHYLSIVLVCAAAFACFSQVDAQESAPGMSALPYTLTITKALPSLSGENDKTAWDVSVACEPGREFFAKAGIGGSGVTLRGTIASVADDIFQVAVKISEITTSGLAPGPDGRPLAVISQRDIEITVKTTLGQDLKAGERPLADGGPDHPIEAIHITLEAADSAKAPSTVSVAPSAAPAPGEWHINEDTPRKSGLRLLPGQKQPEFIIAYRTEKPAVGESPLPNFNPKVVTLINEPAKIEINGPSETIVFETLIRKDEGGVLDFHAVLTRETTGKSTGPNDKTTNETTRKESEKLERDITLKPGEEKEVGEFMGVKVFVTVTRVE